MNVPRVRGNHPHEMRLRSLLPIVASLLFVPAIAGAAPPDEVPLVLDVAGAPDVDASALREAIAKETRRPVVLATGDAPSSADRVVVVTSDGRLRVKVVLRPAERDVALEAREADRVKQIALLVGNLTRNEADELVPVPRPRAPAPPPPPPAPAPSRDPDPEVAYQRLEATLKWHAEADGKADVPLAVARVTLGALGIPLGLHIWNRLDEEEAGIAFFANSSVWVLLGSADLLLGPGRSAYGRLHAGLVLARGEGGAAAAVARSEESWLHLARRERLARRILGGIGIGVGVLSFGVGAGLALTSSGAEADRGRGVASALTMTLGALTTALGIHLWCVPQGAESDYEAYRRTSGRMQLAPSVAVVPGGGVIALGGTL